MDAKILGSPRAGFWGPGYHGGWIRPHLKILVIH